MAYDSGYQQAAARLSERLGIPPNRPTPRFPKGDIVSRRQGGEAWVKAALALDSEHHQEIEKTEYKIPGHQQAEISLFAYRGKSLQASPSGPAVLYIHGGGMILGSAELFEPVTKADVAATGVAHFSIDYRLAPEFPHPTPIEDCYAALVWLSSHAEELKIDPARIAVAGVSAGGGLAAGVALLARDRGLQPPISKQILLCPMLDNRNIVTDADLLPLMTWSWDDNWTGWNALLGKDFKSASVSQYAAPAKATDLQRLPSAFIDVGSMDIFAEEDQAYAEKLKEAGVDVEWHLYDGVPHGFEIRGIGTNIPRQAMAYRHAAISSL